MTTALTDALDTDVVTADTAEDIGRVTAVVMSGDGSRIERVQIAGRKRNPELVDWSDIESFGADAVMISTADRIVDEPTDRDDEFVRGDTDVIGARILDTDGFEHGTVTDVHFDEADGALQAVMTTDGRIDADRVRSWGGYAVMVAPT